MSDVNPYGAGQKFASLPLDTAMGTRSMVIKRIDPFSCGRILGGLYAILGVVWGGLMFLVGLLSVMINNPGMTAGTGLVTGVFGLVLGPVFFGVFGFVGGAIGAALFNIATGFLGGVKIDVEA